MPSKYVVRVDYDGGYYHVFNRGVEKRTIFLDDRDYVVFLHFLKVFLSKAGVPLLGGDMSGAMENLEGNRRKNYFGEIKLIAYCLMPNHFHLFMHQLSKGALAGFMQSLSNAYTKYFNERYQRVGCLFQGRYKASNINNEVYFQYISKYIHLNPKALGGDIMNYAYSSYRYYLDGRPPVWLHPEVILGEGFSISRYRDFVSDVEDDQRLEVIGDIEN